MKKILIISIIALLQHFIVSAQDLLVTTDGDSIKCKITQIKDEYLYFTLVKNDEVQNNLLHVTNVRSYQYGFFTKAKQQPTEISFSSPTLPKWRLEANIGYCWRTARMAPDLDEFQKMLVKNIRSGIVWDASFSYFFNDYIGFGAIFYQFGKSYETYGTDLNTGKQGNFKLTDRITYFAPAFVMRTPLGRSELWNFDLSAGIGYISYKEKFAIIEENATLSGASVGLHTALGLSYKISPKWAIGFKMQATNGNIWKMTQTDQYGNKTSVEFEENQGESLAQISVNFGFRYFIK